MDSLVKAMGGAVVFLGVVFIGVILGTLFGSFAGWVVGLFYGETVLNILGQLGIHNITMMQFGAFMGFISGFLKTKVSPSDKD